MIDWQQALLNIRAKSGVSLATIARRLNTTERHLNRIARGEVEEPKFSKGIEILDMHFDLMGDKHGSILR